MSGHHPILAFIAGIDEQVRPLSDIEIDDLIRPGPSQGLGDWFGQWLAKTPVDSRQLTLRSLLQSFPNKNYQIFALADGVSIPYDHENPSNALNSVSRHMRFICVILPDLVDEESQPDDGVEDEVELAVTTRTLFVVAGNYPDADGRGSESGASLQCASWDPHAWGKNRGMARFYQRNKQGWIYFGNGFHAYNAASAGKGPFDGHVGGAIIMKARSHLPFAKHQLTISVGVQELAQPWTHWFDTGNVGDFEKSLGSRPDKPSACDPKNVLYDPLFTQGNSAFSRLSRAESLQPVVESCVASWYRSRFQVDFIGPNKQPLPTVSTSIHNWVGHVLLNRAMNIATSRTSTEQIHHTARDVFGIPITFFFNAQAFRDLLPDASFPADAQLDIRNSVYRGGVGRLKLSLFYRDQQGLKVAVPGSEGPFAFPIIEPGVEDYTGIQTLLVNVDRAGLLPTKAIAAMLMVDFCNPLYSLRRESLMRHVPNTASFDTESKTYNVLDQFIASVRGSEEAGDPQSPESEILELLSVPDDKYVEVFTARVNDYLHKVSERFKNGLEAAVEDYMVLAEGRRRLYRNIENAKPDGGLNEFTLTLPFAEQEVPSTRMKKDGYTEVEQRVKLKERAGASCCPVYMAREDVTETV